ncbi:MAG: TrmH family RNA methyltransferase, partial [Anaerolineales bacterium]
VAPFPQLKLPVEPSFLVAVDQLADPGNLGTLLRTSLAAGVEGLVLTPGTVDPFNPKVVRGAMGALLHIPLQWAKPSELKSALAGLPLWLAETNQGPAYTQVDWQPPCALLIGSEAHGARAKLAELADQVTHIPMEGPADSLNAAVAAAVILFEIRRQRGKA